ncbi:dehydrogenase with different specificitie [Amniculicola lignicola CBS 123094]|uniref:Dehydrogenase with different specificitie n=1 Tax=Amniculicola lignicola CBS 123094 TaxID=1392246 RepID=A0A6A5X514_9PLEO|nr:dehydrogenase with different specificitie [Amniculicola lignicola CBS 123094]
MSPQTLQGKVAVVTGASRGIGAGLGLELARRGAKVALVYTSARSEQPTKDLVSKIEAFGNGSQGIAIQADLSKVYAADGIVAATRTAFGNHIDILVNNAGVLFEKTLLETTAEDYVRIFDVNVRGVLLMSKAVVPYLRKPGRIINLSSIGGRKGFAGLGLYTSSKAAVEGLTRSLAVELGDAGHTVNAVAPGPTESDMIRQMSDEFIVKQERETPVEHRIGTVDDIAQIIAFLASEESRWVSGQTISASGGFQMY